MARTKKTEKKEKKTKRKVAKPTAKQLAHRSKMSNAADKWNGLSDTQKKKYDNKFNLYFAEYAKKH